MHSKHTQGRKHSSTQHIHGTLSSSSSSSAALVSVKPRYQQLPLC